MTNFALPQKDITKNCGYETYKEIICKEFSEAAMCFCWQVVL